jgi:EamA domain-containing membrane protein RarD
VTLSEKLFLLTIIKIAVAQTTPACLMFLCGTFQHVTCCVSFIYAVYYLTHMTSLHIPRGQGFSLFYSLLHLLCPNIARRVTGAQEVLCEGVNEGDWG